MIAPRTRVALSLNSAIENGMNLIFGAAEEGGAQSVKNSESTSGLNLQEWTKAETTVVIAEVTTMKAIFNGFVSGARRTDGPSSLGDS